MIRVNGAPVSFQMFRDGSFRAKFDTRGYDEYKVLWKFGGEIETLELFYLVRHIRDYTKTTPITLRMPYIPEARMDRTRNVEEIFTLKHFAALLNSLELDRVEVYDPHSHVSEALINNLKVITPVHEFELLKALHPNFIFFYPDEGACKKYKDIAGKVPYNFSLKEREWASGHISNLNLYGDPVNFIGKDVIICDDIISRGNTVYMAAKQIAAYAPAHIVVWVSHCESTIFGPHCDGKSLLDYDFISKVYTTDSLERTQTHPKIEVIKEFV